MRALLLSLVLLPALAAAQDGTPDPAFGTNGRVTLPLGTSANEAATTLARMADGRLVVAGTTGDFGTVDVAVVRLLADGSPDPSFGRNGRASFDVAGAAEYVDDLLVLADGRIVVVGAAGDPGSTRLRAFVARLTSAGRLDVSFGVGGLVRTESEAAVAVARDAAGRLVIAGTQLTSDGTPAPAVTRLLPDGAPDALFAEAGTLVFSFFGSGTGRTENLKAVAVDTAGRIVVAGEARGQFSGSGIGVARLLPDGAPDLSFGQNGQTTETWPSASVWVAGMRIDGSGRVVVAGTYDNPIAGPRNQMTAVRFTADGALDASFGQGGRATAVYEGTSNITAALEIDAAGRTVLAGISSTPPLSSAVVVRLLPDGAPDASFGQGGRADIDLSNRFDRGVSALALQPDGAPLIAGTAVQVIANAPPSTTDMTVARFTPAGALDVAFGTAGLVRLGGVGDGLSEAQMVQPLLGGKTLVVGTALRDGESYVVLARLTATGALDATFGSDGSAALPVRSALAPTAMAFQLDGRTVLAGWLPLPGIGGQGSLQVARITADGRLDPTFGTGGLTPGLTSVPSYPQEIAFQPDGRIVVAGRFENQIGVVRLEPDGRLDASFGTDGRVGIDLGDSFAGIGALALDAAGRIVVVGTLEGAESLMLAIRWLPDGSPDRAFGTDGVATVGFDGASARAHALGVLHDGRLVLAGRVSPPDGGGGTTAFARLTESGALDGAFGVGGRVSLDLVSQGGAETLAIDAAGRLVAAGYAVRIDDPAAISVVRLSASGELDGTFGANGLAVVGRAGYVSVRSLALDAEGRILVAGLAGTSFLAYDASVVRLLSDGSVATEPLAGRATRLSVLPNPVRGRAEVRLETPQGEHVRVELFDVLGRRVLTVHDAPLAAGAHTFALDAGALPAGTYLLRATGASVRLARTVTVAR